MSPRLDPHGWFSKRATSIVVRLLVLLGFLAAIVPPATAASFSQDPATGEVSWTHSKGNFEPNKGFQAGNFFAGGYSLRIPNPPAGGVQVTVTNASVSVPVTCPAGGAGGTITAPVPDRSFNITNDDQYPVGNMSDKDPLHYTNNWIVIPDLCNGGEMAASDVTFTFTPVSTPTLSRMEVNFAYAYGKLSCQTAWDDKECKASSWFGKHDVFTMPLTGGARIKIDPQTAANHIGDPHELTVTVEKKPGASNAFEPATNTLVTLSKVSGPGSLPTPPTCTTDAAGQCDVTLTSNTTGLSVVKAEADVLVDAVTVHVETNGQAGNSGPANKRWVDEQLTLTPPQATNIVGDPHVFTAHLEFDTGSGFAPAGANETINFTKVSGVGTLDAPPTCTTDANGECDITLNSTQTGSTVVGASWNGVIATAEGNVNGSASDEAGKLWVDVDARIKIDPPTAANHVGDPHDLTVTVEKKPSAGNAFVPANNVLVTLSKVSGPGSLPTPPTCTTDAAGQCTVTLESNITGLSVVKAEADVLVDTKTLHVETDGVADNSGPAEKRWVDERLTLTPPSAVNHVGDPHVFTALLEFDTGSGFTSAGANKTINFTKVSGVGTLDTPPTCTTDAAGECDITLNSTETGSTVVGASWNGVIATAEGNVNGSAADEAGKRWVDALILINPPQDTNEVGDDHVFTVTVKKSEQGVVSNAVGVDVQTSITSGPGSYVGSDACTTDANGECDVTITSTDSGLTVVEAEATVTVDGVDVLVKTDGLFNNSEPATKRWVDARLSVTPPEATNVIGDTHTFAAHLEFDLGDGAGFVDAPAGEVVTWTKTGPGTFVSDSCTTDADGTCSVELDSDEVGTTEVEASWTGAVTTAEGSATMTRSDGATKDWVEPAIRIIKTANPVLGPPRTVTFTYLVTNIGDVTLTNVDVTDDIIGFIGTIDSLDPGESATLTKDSEVDENTPRTNVGTACGDPTVGGVVIGKEVCDDDPASIVVVLPQPPEERRLPRTGFGLRQWLFIAGLFLAAGAAGLNLELKTANDRGRSS